MKQGHSPSGATRVRKSPEFESYAAVETRAAGGANHSLPPSCGTNRSGTSDIGSTI